MNRRELMTALPAPALASAETPDPFLPLYRDWRAGWADWYALADRPGNGNWDDPASLAAERRASGALEAMLQTNPTSRTGFAALADVLWSLEGPSTAPDSPELNEEADRLSIRLIRRLWEAGSGQSGYPPSAAFNSAGEDWLDGAVA